MFLSDCDMHMHTACSDGELFPIDFLIFAHENKVRYFSVTDHDTVDFYLNKDVLKLAKKFKMNYITGCEFVCRVKNFPIEILGYGIDINTTKKYLNQHGVPEEKMREMRIKKGKKIFKKLGFNLNFIEGDKTDPVDIIYEAILAQDELKQRLLKENSNMLNSSGKLLRLGLNNPNSCIFINPRFYYPSYKKIIKLIHRKFHGIAVLAHPYHYDYKMNMVIEKCLQAKIDGIECYHYTVDSLEKNKKLLNFAKEKNLVVTGGSDFHTKSDIHLIREKKMIKVPQKVFFNIKKFIDKKNSLK